VDFYASQESARRTTRWLVVAFFVCVVLVVAAVDAVIVILLGATERNVSPAGPIAASTIIVLCIVCGSSLFKIWSLRRGGAVVARNLGATRVRRETSDFALKRLLNVVEEMSIASGVTMPEVYVLEDEDGINAFAAGHSPADAAVVVTRGAIARLKREELQGVIAHEFSHVLNGDSRLYLRLLGLTFGLLAIAIVARFVLQSGARGKSDRKGGGAAIVLAALAVMALGYIGVFFGRLLQAAVSRHRERLADASAVQFTRNPLGLKGALLKVAGVDSGSTLANPGAEQVAHMLFAPGMQRLMRTHPTIEERLEAIVPGFRAAELPALAAAAARDAERMIAADIEANTANFTAPGAPAGAGIGRNPLMPAGLRAAGLPSAVPASAQAFVGQVGSLQNEHVRYAEQARLAIPGPLREFADSPTHARALILSVVMSRQPAVEAKQREIVERAFGAGVFETVSGMRPLSDSLEPQLRLPTLQQIFPALRDLSRAERQQLRDVVEQLSQADARIDVFECCLALLLAANLEDEMDHRAPHGSASLLQEAASVQALLSILAARGADGPEQAAAAYGAGIAVVLPGPPPPPPYLVSDAWPKALADALSNLAALRPFAKKVLIDGLARCVSHDGKLTIEESELLRTTCAVLHCPLPPIVAQPDGE
jgi:Zn-dependent protease with chaperone function